MCSCVSMFRGRKGWLVISFEKELHAWLITFWHWEHSVTLAQKQCKWHFGQNSFFALIGVCSQDTLPGKVLYLDSIYFSSYSNFWKNYIENMYKKFQRKNLVSALKRFLRWKNGSALKCCKCKFGKKSKISGLMDFFGISDKFTLYNTCKRI